MKLRITLLSMLVSLSLATIAVPANAETIIYDNGPGSFLGVAPPSIGHMNGIDWTTSNTIQCANRCTPTDITFWTRSPIDVPVPTGETIHWSFTSGPNFGVGFNSGSSTIPSAIPCTTNGIDNLCIVHIDLAGTLSQPAFSWLNLWGLSNDVDWAFSPTSSNDAQTCARDATGACSGITVTGIVGEGFSVSGTVVPEPSSMLLLSSGVLGLAGVLRRKLMR